MKKVMYIERRLKKRLLKDINLVLYKNPHANLVGLVHRSNNLTAFIQYEGDINTEGLDDDYYRI